MEHGSGSELNKLIAQDQRVDMRRNLDYDHNSLIEAQHMLGVHAGRQRGLYSTVEYESQSGSGHSAQQPWIPQRRNLRRRQKHEDLVVWTAGEPSIVLTVAKLSVGSVLTQGGAAFHADAT